MKRLNLRQSLTFAGRNAAVRILTAFLVFTLIAGPLASIASAEETVNSIELQVPSTSLFVEDTPITLTAMANIQGQNGQKDVTAEATWTSSSSVVKVSKGVVTATGAASFVTITAKYGGKSASTILHASFKYDSLKLKINASSPTDALDSLDVELGASLQLGAAGVYTNGTEEMVTNEAGWTTSNTNVATVSNGVVTLLSAGTVTITAKHKGKSDSIALTVTSPYSSLTVSTSDGREGTIEFNIGEDDIKLIAKATLKSGTSEPQDITSAAAWTSSNNGVVKVSSSGEVTAVGQGTAVVTAKRYGVSDSVTFIVRSIYEGIKVTPDKSIAVTLYSADVELQAFMIKGTADPIPATELAEWTIADPFVGTIVKSTEVKKAFFKPKGVGTTKITASYKGQTKDIAVTVYPSINTVDISKDRLDVFVEENGSLPSVSGITASGDTKDISKLVKWRSNDSTIVSVEDGKWTAKKEGTVTLTAAVENESTSTGTVTKEDTITLQVHKKVLTLIPQTDMISVVIGKETDLPAVTLIYEDGEEETITDKIAWKSSSANLLVKPPKMKGLLPASTTLTGTYLNKSVKIKVQVEEEFTSFKIEPKALNLLLNRSQTVKVTGITKSGKKINLGSRIDWKSSIEDLVTIRGSSVRGLAEGSGKLKATVQGKGLVVPYTVTARVTKLTPSVTSLQSTVGQKETVSLTALYENDRTINATSSAVWTSTNSKVATVSAGSITIIGKGYAYIKASFAGKTVNIRISVK